MTAHLLRSPDGTLLGGAGTDLTGSWSWWARWTSGQRIRVASEEEALRALPSLASLPGRPSAPRAGL